MSFVAYLSHPIGDEDDPGLRGDNIANAGKWLNFLVDNTRWAILCPWLAYTTTLSQTMYGPRALMDQILLLERCDILVQVGGHISPHMTIERNHAVRQGLPVVDLTRFGLSPGTRDAVRMSIAKDLRRQIDRARGMMKRRVWLPPFSAENVTALRAAELTLRADPYAEEARLLIQKIIAAAIRVD